MNRPEPNRDPRPGRPSSDEIKRTNKPVSPPPQNEEEPEDRRSATF